MAQNGDLFRISSGSDFLLDRRHQIGIQGIGGSQRTYFNLAIARDRTRWRFLDSFHIVGNQTDRWSQNRLWGPIVEIEMHGFEREILEHHLGVAQIQRMRVAELIKCLIIIARQHHERILTGRVVNQHGIEPGDILTLIHHNLIELVLQLGADGL